jgi:hypothetical protein
MQPCNLQLDAREREYLASLVEADLAETRVEVRRTDTPGYHEELLEKERLIKGLLTRLRPTAS